MLFREIAKVLSSYLAIFALLLLLPLSFSIYDGWKGEAEATLAFAETFLIVLGAAFFCYFIGRKARGKLYRREGLTLVVILWFFIPFFGRASLPFSSLFWAGFPTFFKECFRVLCTPTSNR